MQVADKNDGLARFLWAHFPRPGVKLPPYLVGATGISVMFLNDWEEHRGVTQFDTILLVALSPASQQETATGQF